MTAGTSWPDRMITQAEAFAKAANWPVIADHERDENWVENTATIVLRCSKDTSRPDNPQLKTFCGQSIGQLRRNETAYNGSLDEMLSMVLRHMVMAHDEPLNTRPRSVDRPSGSEVAGPGLQDNGPSDGSTHGT